MLSSENSTIGSGIPVALAKPSKNAILEKFRNDMKASLFNPPEDIPYQEPVSQPYSTDLEPNFSLQEEIKDDKCLDSAGKNRKLENLRAKIKNSLFASSPMQYTNPVITKDPSADYPSDDLENDDDDDDDYDYSKDMLNDMSASSGQEIV